MSGGEGCYILTLPLKTELYQEHILEKHFRLGEELYNKFLNFEKRNIMKWQNAEIIEMLKVL